MVRLDPPHETDISNDDALGGYFSATGRASAISAALRLVGSYFSASAERHSLSTSPAGLAAAQEEVSRDNALSALALRVALSASDRLIEIANVIVVRPSFRYKIESFESVGAIAGQLDTARWVQRLHEVRSPQTYPIRRVERSQLTPENELASLAIVALRHELEQAYDDALPPPGSPDAAAARAAIDQLGRISSMHPFAEILRNIDPSRIDDERMTSLAEHVHRRADTGRIARPEPYLDLAAWVEKPRIADMLSGSDIDWSFYGASFDTTLFELWCMDQVATYLSEILGQPDCVPDLRPRSTARAYGWQLEDVSVALHFQRDISASTRSGVVVWRQANGAPLGGRPDLTVEVTSSKKPGASQYIFLDPKLRQRSRLPTEEVYKLIGYFSNSGFGDEGRGAIMTYSPTPNFPQVITLESSAGGIAIAAGFDPARPEVNVNSLDAVASLVLEAVTKSASDS